MASNPLAKLTEEQYLAIERAAETKSEFVNGTMFSMSGASLRHALIGANLLGELHARLRGGGCRVITADLRVHVPATGLYTYPDATIVCGPPLLRDAHQDTLQNPSVIFEVLSPSTEGYDRGAKFQHYRTITTLTDYVLVDQSKMRVEHFSRQTGETWTLHDTMRPEDELRIDSINVSLPLALIYEGIAFDPMETVSVLA
ncbi:MAG: Uma2 family endonuclease [Bryobacteraceae bacterium]